MVAEKKKTIVLYCLLAVALVGILSGTILGVYNAKAIHTLQTAAGISPDGETQGQRRHHEWRIPNPLHPAHLRRLQVRQHLWPQQQAKGDLGDGQRGAG